MLAERLTRRGTKRPSTGIVHLGLGAFFRAFGCVYVADAMQASGGDWGIVGVSLLNPIRATRCARRTGPIPRSRWCPTGHSFARSMC